MQARFAIPILSAVLLQASSLRAQFIEPEWRGNADTEHAQWDEFSSPFEDPNLPDVAVDAPTMDAQLVCTTSSAFLTSTQNIYSFQSPTSFQIDDSSLFPVQAVFFQVATFGSTIDPESVRMIALDGEGNPYLAEPTSSFLIDQAALPPSEQGGGFDTVWAFQWDFSAQPFTGTWSILFSAAESSMSLDQVSIDTSATFELVPEPAPPLEFALEPNHASSTLTLTWPAYYHGIATLQQTNDPSDPDSWQDVVETVLISETQCVLEMPMGDGTTLFRLLVL